jgi:hypothetical protein
MRTVGLMLGVLALAVPARSDDIYKWTDPAGNVHYSNTPSATENGTTVTSGGVPEEDAAPPRAPDDRAATAPGDGAGEAQPAGDADTYSASVSTRRNALERDLRATERRLRDVDARLAALARARTQHAGGGTATGGVGTQALDVRSEEEKALATQREELAQHATEIKSQAAQLRAEVTARYGSTPPWWIELR